MREDIDHQTAKAKFFENRHFVVLAELQKRDKDIQQLEEQIQHLSRIIRDREEELKEKAKTSDSRGHIFRKVAVNSTHAHRRLESTSNWKCDLYLVSEWAEEEQVPGSTAVRFFGTRGRVHREEEANITM